MTDRERLTELLKADLEYFSNDIKYWHDEHIGALADHLLANGVVVQKHGRWEDKATGAYRRTQSWCTACGKHSGIGGIESNRHKPYCPNCGARMGEEAHDKD